MKLPFDPTVVPTLPRSLPQPLQRAATWYNVRPIRERLLILGACMAIVFTLIDQAWVTPSARRQAAQKAIGAGAQADPRAIASRSSDLLERLKATELTAEQSAKSARERASQAAEALKAQVQATVSAEQMPALLRELMHDRSRCTAGDSSPPRPCAAGPVIRALKSIGEREPYLSDGGSATGETVTLWRHGVELVLEGSFAELQAYVEALQNLPQRIKHGEMRLEAGKYPSATLTLKLYTLSLDRTWLTI